MHAYACVSSRAVSIFFGVMRQQVAMAVQYRSYVQEICDAVPFRPDAAICALDCATRKITHRTVA